MKNSKSLKIFDNIKHYLPIILIILILAIAYCLFTENNTSNTIELFSSSFLNQYGNVIYHFNGSLEDINNEPSISVSENDSHMIYTVNLDKKSHITDLYLDLHLINKSKTINVGVFDSRKNAIDLININPIDNIDTTSKTITTAVSFNDVKDKFNNNLYGNQIIIYVMKDNLDTTTTEAQTTTTEAQTTTTNTTQQQVITISVCGISLESNISESRMEFLVDKSKEINNSEIVSINDLAVFPDIPIEKLKLYTLTLIDFSNIILDDEIVFQILYTNTHTNEIMTYKSDKRDGKFIVNSTFPKVILYNDILMVNKIYLKGIPTSVNLQDLVIKGYLSTVNDINQFKLQHNITDIRGSINPDDVCPSVDNLLQEQLNSETIIDAIDFQNKINEEKIKLNSRKDALLNLLEQKEDIHRLGSMLDTIDNMTQKRNMDTDTYNAIKLNKQINEIARLKEVLDARIQLNKNNTHNFDKINLIIKRDATDDEIIKRNLEENTVSGGIVIDGFTNLPIDEHMKL